MRTTGLTVSITLKASDVNAAIRHRELQNASRAIINRWEARRAAGEMINGLASTDDEHREVDAMHKEMDRLETSLAYVVIHEVNAHHVHPGVPASLYMDQDESGDVRLVTTERR